MATLRELSEEILSQETALRKGGGPAGHKRQERLGRLTVRDRLQLLLDPDSQFFEVGLWAANEMYPDWGSVPAAGVVTGIGRVGGVWCMVAAHDATVKAGAMFPQSVKKLIRAQKIALQFRLPVIYLVDSAGVFLPLQDEIFPDEDDFGRIFRNNAVLSAEGIPQYAAVMGNCIAGGAYLPVLCDTLLMTQGSQLCLAGAALVKAAIGQDADPEELGGADMHAAISGTVDFLEPDDRACLKRVRSLVSNLAAAKVLHARSENASTDNSEQSGAVDSSRVYDIVPGDGQSEYETRDLLEAICDVGSIDEYKAEYGQTLVTAFARFDGRPVGIIASQRKRSRSAEGEIRIGGVIYADAAEKAARFIMDCNQVRIPLIFIQDVQGFMVGKQAEQGGIIRSGAKLVNVISNSVVPKITLIVGGSFGAGHYALCGKAYDPTLILAWPSAQYAVMGGGQAAKTLLALEIRDRERAGTKLSEEEIATIRSAIQRRYKDQTDIRYGAARGWVDAIIPPHSTRDWLSLAVNLMSVQADRDFRTGVLQV